MKHPFRVALVVVAGLRGAAAATEHAGGADRVSCPRRFDVVSGEIFGVEEYR